MQILINGRFLSRPVTGVERYALDMSALILKNRPEASFIVPARGGSVPHKRTIRSGTGHGHFWEQTTLARESRKSDLLVNLANTGPLMGGKQIVAIHDLAFWHHPEWFKKGFARAYRELIPRLARQAQHIITVSECSKRDLCRTLAIDPNKITVVPPYTQFRAIHDKPSRMDRPYLLMVGTLDPRKNISKAIEAFKRIANKNVDLVIVGRKIKSFRRIEPYIDDPRITLLDNVTDDHLETLYKGATALVSTSVFEGFGLPLLEAMACGTPVIASDLPVFREQFSDAPYYVNHNDVGQISNAIDRFIYHEDLARFHSRKGVALANTFTAERSWKILNRIFDQQLQHA